MRWRFKGKRRERKRAPTRVAAASGGMAALPPVLKWLFINQSDTKRKVSLAYQWQNIANSTERFYLEPFRMVYSTHNQYADVHHWIYYLKHLLLSLFQQAKCIRQYCQHSIIRKVNKSNQ